MNDQKKHILLKTFLKEFEKARLVKRSAKRFELMHDSLADKVAQKRNANEVAYIEAVRLLKSKLRLSGRAETKDLFTEKQLIYLNPYLQKNKIRTEFSPEDWVGCEKLLEESQQRIDAEKEKEKTRLEKEKEDLIEKQKLLKKNQRNQRRFIYFLSAATVVFAGLFIYAYILQNRLMHSQLKTADELKVQGSYDEALRALSELDNKFSSASFNKTVQQKKATFLQIKKWMAAADQFLKDTNYHRSLIFIDSALQYSPDNFIETKKQATTKERDGKVASLKTEIMNEIALSKSISAESPINSAKEDYLKAIFFDPSFDPQGVLKKEINQELERYGLERLPDR